MKACMLAYTFYDADNRVRRYAEALVRRGDQVDAIALARPGQPAFEVIRGVRVFRIQKRTINESGPFSYLVKLLLFFIRSCFFLAVRSFREPYDLIHVHSVPDFEVFATIVPRLLGTRVILDIHDIVPEFYASKFKVRQQSLIFRALVLVERLSIAYSHHVIIANHLWYETLTRRSVRPEKCTAIINYPDPTIFSRRGRPARPGSEFVLCYPGTLSWHQGLDIAIEAMALLRTEIPGLRLKLIGDGPERENLSRLIQQRGLGDRISLTGLIPMEQVAEMMESIDLGVVPKRADSFGNEAFSTKIMEFMAMNVPVLASRTRVDEYYFHDGIVQFFESGNAQDLADKIRYLYYDSARRAELRTGSSKFIAQNSWDIRQQEYFGLIDRLAPKRQLVVA
ncbi:glycosyltransferase family 4 protein [Acidobacteria bacterium AB60]|nr:glycosyltransferase family 4 protein [Acidobacteria bacterium AB60]